MITYVRAEHDRSLLGGSNGIHLDVPLVWGQGVGHVGDDFTRETLHTIRVNKRKGDGAGGVRNNRPVAPVPVKSQRQVVHHFR